MKSEYIRSTHLVGPPVPKIPGLGTTWYQRGPGYWARRGTIVTGVLLLVVGFVAFLTIFLIGLTSDLSPSATVAVVVVAVLCIAWSLVAATRANLHRTKRHGDEPATRPKTNGGLGLGTAASAGSVVAGLFLFIGSLFAIGWFVVLLVMSCRRYSGPAEKAAVLAVQDWKAQHPEWRP